jgi:trehalose utilization protein
MMHHRKTSAQLAQCATLLSFFALACGSATAADKPPVRVLVWDEQQPAQKEAYDDFIGGAIAAHLTQQPGLAVRRARMDDPEQGLADELLDNIDVLVWWGHVRQREIKPERAKRIVERIKQGRLSLVALHSAHWSTPFIEAMNERARQDALAQLEPGERESAKVEEIAAAIGTVPAYDAPLTPSAQFRKPPGGPVTVRLKLPNCCFPAYRPDGKPSTLRTRLVDHPLARGIPAEFVNARDEMYDEPFHVPAPDDVVFEERFSGGEWFRSGSVWRIGAGRVFYFRPGHETFPVYKDPVMLKIIENAVRWLPQ